MNIGKLKFRGDTYIWFAIICLSLLGLMAVYSATGSLAFRKQDGNTEYYLFKHALFLFGGFFLMYFFHLLDYKYFSRISQFAVIIALPLLLATLIFGNDHNNAKRTITLLGITFQASDFAKFAIIMFIARYLSKKQEEMNSWKGFGAILAWICGICFLIMPENLSTSLVLFFTCYLLLFIGNARLKHLLLLGCSFAIIGLIAFFTLLKAPDSMLPGRAATWKARLENFTGKDSTEEFQTVQSKIAVINGGFFGKGPGKGEQSAYLPEAYSDYIFATIIEEYGLFGAIVSIFLYLLILYRTIRIVLKSPKAFGALLALGLAFSLVLQALIHMAVATSLFPVTGLTLPLISNGGTSLLFTTAAFGILLSVSRTIEEQDLPQNNTEKGDNIVTA
ncbi:MAG: FtsW/RodA/SpoVE family cell cycle protein [Bacteroidetes bacterium]|nr:FtsW/RodA/SpoVE family cell cycle protein [Bacteroidota bacterium]